MTRRVPMTPFLFMQMRSEHRSESTNQRVLDRCKTLSTEEGSLGSNSAGSNANAKATDKRRKAVNAADNSPATGAASKVVMTTETKRRIKRQQQQQGKMKQTQQKDDKADKGWKYKKVRLAV